jgi:hypothetical protein
MFVRLVFRRFGIRENKYLMAMAYGLAYAILFFLALYISMIYLRRANFMMAFLLSLFVGMLMFVVYLIKEEVFKFKK